MQSKVTVQVTTDSNITKTQNEMISTLFLLSLYSCLAKDNKYQSPYLTDPIFV